MILGGPHQHLWGSFTVVCRETPFWVTVLQGTLSGSSPDLVAKIQREQKPPKADCGTPAEHASLARKAGGQK